MCFVFPSYTREGQAPAYRDLASGTGDWGKSKTPPETGPDPESPFTR